MGQEFLKKEKDVPHKSYTEVFYEQLPFYLAIGMSLTEYFDEDSCLAKYFRQAYRIKQEEQDYTAWLQGLYVLKAVDCATYNNPPFAKRGREPRQYFDEPFLQSSKNEGVVLDEEQEALKKEEEEARMGAWLENFVNLYR